VDVLVRHKQVRSVVIARIGALCCYTWIGNEPVPADMGALLTRISTKKFTPQAKAALNGLEKDDRNFINSLMNSNPSKRPTAAECLEDTIFK
jgi:hypothetical protein